MARKSTRRVRLPHAGREGGGSTTALGGLLLKALRWIGEVLWELCGEDLLQVILVAALALGGAYLLDAVAPKAVTDWVRELPDEFFLLAVFAVIVICVAAGAAVLLVRGARWVRGHVRWTKFRGGEH